MIIRLNSSLHTIIVIATAAGSLLTGVNNEKNTLLRHQSGSQEIQQMLNNKSALTLDFMRTIGKEKILIKDASSSQSKSLHKLIFSAYLSRNNMLTNTGIRVIQTRTQQLQITLYEPQLYDMLEVKALR